MEFSAFEKLAANSQGAIRRSSGPFSSRFAEPREESRPEPYERSRPWLLLLAVVRIATRRCRHGGIDCYLHSRQDPGALAGREARCQQAIIDLSGHCEAVEPTATPNSYQTPVLTSKR